MIVTGDHGLLITAIFWGAIVLIVLVTNFFGYRERASRHRAIERLAEKGQPIPPELLGGYGRGYRDGPRGWYRYSLSGGIYLMCVGVALFVFLWAMTNGSLNAFFRCRLSIYDWPQPRARLSLRPPAHAAPMRGYAGAGWTRAS